MDDRITIKGTIIVEGTFNEGYEKYFTDYSLKIEAFLNQFEATVIRRQLIQETLYGQERPNLIMLIDFADKEVARKIFFEQEYLSIIPLREKVFKTFKMYLADFDNV
jgi:uncharacterized protein (DUF1330 family)